jgi:monothiol glutaredoxin
MPPDGGNRASLGSLGGRSAVDVSLNLGIKEYSEWPTIPQLYIDKEFVGGCDILVSMHQNGELAKMLEERKVLLLEDDEGKKPES